MIQLVFANGQHAHADLVVGADGIRSTVTRLWIPKAPSPRPLHIRLILGLTIASSGFDGHALVDERGFYTLDIGIRLFVMPYAGDSLEEHEAHQLISCKLLRVSAKTPPQQQTRLQDHNMADWIHRAPSRFATCERKLLR